MIREPRFTPIDLQTWKRGQMFYYFSKMAPTGYSLTVKLDITKMKAALDEAKLKFFPAYLWLVTKTLNQQEEFRTGSPSPCTFRRRGAFICIYTSITYLQLHSHFC